MIVINNVVKKNKPIAFGNVVFSPGTEFDNVDLSGCSFHEAQFSSDCKFRDVNFSNCDFENLNLNSGCKFISCNLRGVINLPDYMNTKAKFIAAVGAGNVDAETIWIDGTSILAE